MLYLIGAHPHKNTNVACAMTGRQLVMLHHARKESFLMRRCLLKENVDGINGSVIPSGRNMQRNTEVLTDPPGCDVTA